MQMPFTTLQAWDVWTSAFCPAGAGDAPAQTQGIEQVIQEIVKCVSPHPAPPSGPFKFAIDHCFAIRGQGTVLTGTALSGTAKVGDSIELPELKVCV